MLSKPEFYGSSTVGERGQIVLPIELRKKFGIQAGDKLLVLGGEEDTIWGVTLVKSEILSKMMTMVGNNIGDILKKSEGE